VPPAPPIGLEEATRLEGEDGRFSTSLDEAWEIWGPSGGYLAAIALRAAGRCAEIPRPASFSCHFLSAPAFDEIELGVAVLKRGRRSEALSVAMTQRRKPILQALVRTAADAPGYRHQEPAAPAVAPPDASAPLNPTKYNFWKNVTWRRPEVAGEPAAALVRDWLRFEPTPCFEDPFVDAARPLILLDTFGWPAVFARYRGADYTAPSLDICVNFHRPAAGCEWLLIDHACPVADEGLLGVSGRVWSEDGRLLATGIAQLCCIPLRSETKAA
jgi:acyl-CoA thioesterase II